ncbi:MAG TPA: TM0106 family RecB-like putative nuclease, partial [Methyloceanibacter sp.]|nr:TM0106 family RecB-like putative nuclease [Methyloceanibacter sp.]
MRSVDGVIYFSAADLVGHLSCRHLTRLDAAVARGELEAPKVFDPLLEVLWERGAAHEKAYVEHLENNGLDVTRVDGSDGDLPVDETLRAMHDGRQIIVQGALGDGRWSGRTDILKRLDGASALGDWSYEVLDTKLARRTKGGTILQLSLYSDLVAGIQDRLPELMSVVAPWSEFQPQVFRTNDYAAYYRLVRQSLEAQLDGKADGDTYPDPKPYCEICRWRERCDAQRRGDDHLSLVAGISRLQIGELAKQGINTVAALASMPLPLTWKPDRGAGQTYERAREQARVQVEARTKGAPVYETLPPEPGFGLARLPEPSPGDIFLDLEADPYVGETGLEFLFGDVITGEDGQSQYTSIWAFSREEEKRAFETFIDRAIERWKQHPGMHIYHYAPYEPAALKRLMGRYATREEELDQMLRAELLVDLFAVVRHAIRAGVESYSIKQLEQFYGLKRAIDLPEANRALARIQVCLELADIEGIRDEEKAAVDGYNRDDCLSAFALRQWLEDIRDKLVAEGAVIERPVAGDGDPSAAISDWQKRIEPVIAGLVAGVPANPEERTAEQQARWMLASLIDWHRREDKATWWEYFRLRDLSAEELMEERAALAGLSFIEAAGGTVKAPIHRYSFPQQDTDLRGGASLHSLGGDKLGTLDGISADTRTADIKKRKDSADTHPPAAFAHDFIDKK